MPHYEIEAYKQLASEQDGFVNLRGCISTTWDSQLVKDFSRTQAISKDSMPVIFHIQMLNKNNGKGFIWLNSS